MPDAASPKRIREATIAADAVARALGLCAAVRAAGPAEALAKADGSPVTLADFASQAVIGRALGAGFPDDPVVGEEGEEGLAGAAGRERLDRVARLVRTVAPDADPDAVRAWIARGGGAPAGRFWTVDPLDGTKGFLRGGAWAVALALIESGRAEVGVVGCPDLDGSGPVVLTAIRGGGVTCRPAPGATVPGGPVVARRPPRRRIAESFEPGHGDRELHDAVARGLGLGEAPLRMDGQGKYAAVALGLAAVYLRLPARGTPERKERIWDHAAGSLLVEETGGAVTDADGRSLEFGAGRTLERNRGIVAGAAEWHARAIDALRRGATT